VMRAPWTRRCKESSSASRNREKGWGEDGEEGGPLAGAAWVVVAAGGLKAGVLTQWRPGHKMDLDLQERRRQ
jgi:hypothetical protein